MEPETKGQQETLAAEQCGRNIKPETCHSEIPFTRRQDRARTAGSVPAIGTAFV
jgi:hypothetical protein